MYHIKFPWEIFFHNVKLNVAVIKYVMLDHKHANCFIIRCKFSE